MARPPRLCLEPLRPLCIASVPLHNMLSYQPRLHPCTTHGPRAGSHLKPVCRVVRTHAATRQAAVTDDAKQACIQALKAAADKPGSVPPAKVLSAITTLEKAKLKPTGDEWVKALQNRTWRLIYTAGSKDVTACVKGTPKGAGTYVPFTAANVYRNNMFENGIFLSTLASLTFNGPVAVTGVKGQFDVTEMNLGLGPWRFRIPMKTSPPIDQLPAEQRKKLPFFLYAYVDEDIVVARGRSGGIALWSGKRDSEWAAKSGVLQVYG